MNVQCTIKARYNVHKGQLCAHKGTHNILAQIYTHTYTHILIIAIHLIHTIALH